MLSIIITKVENSEQTYQQIRIRIRRFRRSKDNNKTATRDTDTILQTIKYFYPRLKSSISVQRIANKLPRSISPDKQDYARRHGDRVIDNW